MSKVVTNTTCTTPSETNMQQGLQSEGHQTCFCGRSFLGQSAFTNHSRTCRKTKKRLSNALEKAKETWTLNKRRRLDPSGSVGNESPSAGLIQVATQHITEPTVDDSVNVSDDSHLSLIDRRPWTQRINRQLPALFRDIPPQPLPALPPPNITLPTNVTSTPSLDVQCDPCPRRIFTSLSNTFGLYRRYKATEMPSHDPDENLSLQQLANIPAHTTPSNADHRLSYPYPNRSSFLLGNWFWNGGEKKSLASFKNLINILSDPEFRQEDVQNIRWDQINIELAANDVDEWLDEDAGWTRTPVSISVPYHPRRGIPSDFQAGPRNYVVDFYHRSLVDIIREKISGLSDSNLFHFEPYELLWRRPMDQDPIRVQGELYTSPAFIDAHQELQDSPGEPGCNLPRVVISLMLWSDATQLTAFGNAQLWPLYLFFGNDSKYLRCKPSCHLSEHVAYFQKLPDAFKDFASTQTAGGKSPSTAFMTHCHRELTHEQWKILLDDDFLEAWKHGIVIMCWDGIKRRFYPRIFTYSADYPEKILLASIRNRAQCPCPRCLIPLNRVHNLGMARDMTQRVTMPRVDDSQRRSRISSARALIYEKNLQVNSAAVKELLRELSWVPSLNAFCERLSPLGFSIFRALLPDEMHKVELGGWRAIFIHLLRILQSIDDRLLAELDRRYRAIPSFGRDTIRRFSANCSELKKMAAHDFENLLQCAIPVFEGLLPEPHNTAIMDLLFTMAHWHGLAKLRMHNDLTLDLMDAETASLGIKLRKFSRHTCPAFFTKELRREYDTRLRREAKAQSASRSRQTATSDVDTIGAAGQESSSSELPSTHPVAGQPEAGVEAPANVPSTRGSGRRAKTLNLNTYKFHSYGDYVATIRRYGTMDSYSSELGELEHRSPKARFSRTNHKHFIKQLTQIERRQARLRRIRARHKEAGRPTHEEVPISLNAHHVIGKSQNYPEHIPSFLQNNASDPAVKDFIPNLKNHILPRIKNTLLEEASSSSDTQLGQAGLSSARETNTILDRDSVLFKNDRMYSHHLARFNYTTYDARRAQDVINPDTSHCDIMLLTNSCNSDSDTSQDHPFLYARVLGIYHVNVVYTGEGRLDYNARRVDFLWVRWFRYVGNRSRAWNDLRLDSVDFPPMATEGAYGFVDPSDVLRGCHVIPAFASGKAHLDGVGLSRRARDANDWSRYHVNRFVDRDMVMRYHWGFAIGHIYSHGQAAATTNNSTQELHPTTTGSLEEETDQDPELLDQMNAPEDANAEFSLENREDDLGEEIQGSEDEHAEDSDGDDEQLIAMHDMYRSGDFDDE